MRPLSETKKPEIYSEDDFYCIESIESTPYTDKLLHTCQTYLSTKKYSLTSKYDDMARKILNFYNTPVMAKANSVMQEAVSQHILYALYEVLLGKSDTFLALINEVFNYQQEKPKFTKTIPLTNHIKIELLSINKIFTLDINELVFFKELIVFIVANYPEKALQVWPVVNSKLLFDTVTRDCLASHAITLGNWEYLVKLQHDGNFTNIELASKFCEALTIHNFDAKIFKDIFEIIKNQQLVALFLKQMGFDKAVSKLPCTEEHSAFFHALAEAKVYQYLVKATPIDWVNEYYLAKQLYINLSEFALTMVDLKLMAQVLDNVKSFMQNYQLLDFINIVILEKHKFSANKTALYKEIYKLFTSNLEDLWDKIPHINSDSRRNITFMQLLIAIATDDLDCMKKCLLNWFTKDSNDDRRLLTSCINFSRPECFQHIFFHMTNIYMDNIEDFLKIVARVLSHMNTVENACNPAILGIIINHPHITVQKCSVHKYVIEFVVNQHTFIPDRTIIPNEAMIKALERMLLEKSWNMYGLFAQANNLPKEVKAIVGQFIHEKCIEDMSVPYK